MTEKFDAQILDAKGKPIEEGEPKATSPAPGSPDWLKACIAEHKQAQEQASAQANAHSGAWQAYNRLLIEIEQTK